MNKPKHSKIKNTGILFELLTRQITSDMLGGNEKSPSISLFKQYFKKGSILHKEYLLYESIMNTKFTSETKANEFLNLVCKIRNKLSEAKLKREKYALVKAIKENYNLEEFFKQKIPNYKIYASIYQLLENELDETPNSYLESKYTLLEHLIPRNSTPKTLLEQSGLEHLEKESKDIRLLTERIMISKFNEKYAGLNAGQKKLIKMYLSGNANLKDYVISESMILAKLIRSNLNKILDEAVRIKVKETVKILNEISEVKTVKDNHILTLMNFYELIEEMKNIK